ncbi:uncharacterized protein LOC121874606 [Homarus americanus]|uniref:uncharacterized protein LOC121874606 n=1 Tax=Homarus americanus TaxID=6706 RepID=UPI001C4509D2|nr:uncharacterized protein LOC121874606 [Homarus americanus]
MYVSGIIFKRPQKEARDLLTVYLLPFSTNVWICIAISIPVAAFTMYLTTRPRLSLRSLLRRRPPSHARPTSLLESSGESFVPRSRVVESDGKRNPLKKYLRVKPLTTSPLHCFYQDNFFGQGGDVEDEGETKKKDKMRQHTVDSKTLQKAKKKKKVEEEEEETEDVPQSFLSSLWFAATVFMQQGQEVVPERYPARLVFGSMWVASVVLYASYTSNLVSYFTVNKSTLPINNLEELVKSDYKFGTRAGSVYGDNMKASKSEVYKAASAKLESFGKEVTMGTYEEAIQRTLQEPYAFIGDYVGESYTPVAKLSTCVCVDISWIYV